MARRSERTPAPVGRPGASWRGLVNLPTDGHLHAWLPIETLYRRAGSFRAATGLARPDLVVSRFCTTPLPRPADRSGIRPSAMWHPSMWLDRTTSTRHARVTDDDTWALAVAIDLTARGVYDPSSGRWRDVLAEHDLDVDDPGTLDRIRRWLAGDTDLVLDRVRLPEPSVPADVADENDWAVALARRWEADLTQTYLTCDARDIVGTLRGAVHTIGHRSAHAARAAADRIAHAAANAAASFEGHHAADPEWWDGFAAWAMEAFGQTGGRPSHEPAAAPTLEQIRRAAEASTLVNAIARLDALASRPVHPVALDRT